MSVPPDVGSPEVIPVNAEPSIAGKAPVNLDAISCAEPFITVVPSTLNPPSALITKGV